ncbi:hypothetical protein B0T21DRAFT_375883 [Apiosordaria backusii]|uniref:Uncharacterized protein n=1 Tax=Apiosordaria backusii TaxID=314023 RepID=A0AA40AEL9_9PEZI|nr:hypothetical protein B0T21DRAFT_375883 [Apiosordaria backusii]
MMKHMPKPDFERLSQATVKEKCKNVIPYLFPHNPHNPGFCFQACESGLITS